ncbi:MAG TPA: RidA family protein [Burkholderiaceae bacterium]
MRLLLPALLSFLSFTAFAQTPAQAPVPGAAAPLIVKSTPLPSTAATPPLDKKNWYRNEKIEREYGYASAVRIGDTLHISGVPAGGDMAGALRRAYGGLKMVLAAHGLDFRHVVKEVLYTTDIDAVAANKAVRLEFYNGETPAASWVGVTRLLSPQATLEIELTAVFPPMAAPAVLR